VDRASLEQLLAQGLSLAEIGRRADRHEATVAYWLKKYGLEAAHRAKHAARGGLARAELEPMVEAGMSASQIAEVVGLSKTTVRHWLREHGLQTQWARRRTASNERQECMILTCPKHGVTTFRLRDGWLPLCPLSGRGGCQAPKEDQADSRRRGRRSLPDLWLRSVRLGARVPSSGPRGEEFLLEPSRRRTIHREGAGRGQQVLAALCELSCGGGGRTRQSDHVRFCLPTMRLPR